MEAGSLLVGLLLALAAIVCATWLFITRLRSGRGVIRSFGRWCGDVLESIFGI